MNAERQIIGSLLLDSSRMDELKYINSEMFMDTTLGDIYSLYEHADGKEVNQIVIINKLKSDFWTENKIMELLGNLITEHDASISDSFCEDEILKVYKAKKINEFLQHSLVNSNNVEGFIDEAKSLFDGLKVKDTSDVKSLSELTEMKTEYFVENDREQYKLGFPTLDKATGGIDRGDTVIIGARPAVGKSAFALQVIRHFGRNGLKVGYFNLEMSAKQVYERSVASASGIDMTRIRLATNFLNDEQERFEKGNDVLREEKNVFVISGSQSIKSIRACQKAHKFDVVVVDYLQLINVPSYRGNRASEVGEISRGLKAIATDFAIPVIALSQLNRASDKTTDKEPHLSELKESGDIEQDASTVIMMWKSSDEDSTERMIKVEKSRNGFNDHMKLYFDGRHMKFTEDGETDFDTITDKEKEDLPWND